MLQLKLRANSSLCVQTIKVLVYVKTPKGVLLAENLCIRPGSQENVGNSLMPSQVFPSELKRNPRINTLLIS